MVIRVVSVIGFVAYFELEHGELLGIEYSYDARRWRVGLWRMYVVNGRRLYVFEGYIRAFYVCCSIRISYCTNTTPTSNIFIEGHKCTEVTDADLNAVLPRCTLSRSTCYRWFRAQVDRIVEYLEGVGEDQCRELWSRLLAEFGEAQLNALCERINTEFGGVCPDEAVYLSLVERNEIIYGRCNIEGKAVGRPTVIRL